MPKIIKASKVIPLKPKAFTEFYVYLPFDSDTCLSPYQISPAENNIEFFNTHAMSKGEDFLTFMFVKKGIMGARNIDKKQEKEHPRVLELFTTKEEALQSAHTHIPDKRFSVLALKIPAQALVANQIRLNYEYIETIAGYDRNNQLEAVHKVNAIPHTHKPKLKKAS